ncbi:MAG TPA: sigma-70 family RNA polymerase sigma factor [Acidobacteriaceae bacterium]|nr:sigma-70 family RNA polymerase sigma factor [Acidobacteriaceae bacterium]
MAARDGNPGQKNPREIGQSRQPEAPNSEDADALSSPATPLRRRSGGAAGEDPESASRAAPSHRNKPASSLTNQDSSEEVSSSQSEEDAGSEESGNILNEDGLTDPDESPVNPESEGFWEEETQLSSDEGVRQGMGTIALERIPIDEQSARLATSGLPAGLAGDLSQMSDAEIMQRAGAGDEACLEFLIAKYRRPIISFMYRMVHNQAVAEELAQEVFLRVYRARATYRAEARFSTWLYRIASNMAINHARDTKYERASASVFLDQADEDTGTKPDVPDLRPIAEQDMLQDERMRRIREHVMALPERQRMAVVMHKYQDMDYKQIGAVLKLSESATKSLLFRAYQTLREKLKEFA